ncbi:hypothetical protein VKT23_006282 [Stygiomarasmius scandens]|uniref:Uncharacterized protein n=1 Tax=Marasmiellus scandens TaxID=2682957 RepID=A0ABR1JN94_9AGAR
MALDSSEDEYEPSQDVASITPRPKKRLRTSQDLKADSSSGPRPSALNADDLFQQLFQDGGFLDDGIGSQTWADRLFDADESPEIKKEDLSPLLRALSVHEDDADEPHSQAPETELESRVSSSTLPQKVTLNGALVSLDKLLAALIQYKQESDDMQEVVRNMNKERERIVDKLHSKIAKAKEEAQQNMDSSKRLQERLCTAINERDVLEGQTKQLREKIEGFEETKRIELDQLSARYRKELDDLKEDKQCWKEEAVAWRRLGIAFGTQLYDAAKYGAHTLPQYNTPRRG